jgi:hypothetical protein
MIWLFWSELYRAFLFGAPPQEAKPASEVIDLAAHRRARAAARARAL